MLHLQNLFQQTSLQQDLILNLLNSLQPAEVEISDRERLLLTKVSELQSSLTILTEELTAEKSKYVQDLLVTSKLANPMFIKGGLNKPLVKAGFVATRISIASADVSTVVIALDCGFVPVLDGDAILDESLVSSI
ncbi:unnamed protein product [Lactuca saligna]|uniref:Uncharacterized protein n=1 Tax=Lactuca saligna TaxID=75948 RepID=A0AA35V543_LACSI|nr:unnamed protein product [Lactuca saligna]